jgi:hypothetical protein
MAGGILLLANVVGAEGAVISAKGGYERNRQAPFAVLLSPYIGDYQTNINLPATERQTRTLLFNYLAIQPDYERLEAAVEKRNQAWTMYGAYWLLNLVDSYFFSGKNESARITVVPKFDYAPVYALGNQAKWESFLSLNVTYQY